jgi:phosphoglycolate phosphatase
MKLVLFDIDGTLILTGGAGMRAFYSALKQTFQLSVSSEVIRPDGKTDPLIAREFLAHYGQESMWNEQSREELFASYLESLAEEMASSHRRGEIRVLAGVAELLEALAGRPDFALGLVTGNIERGARLKLNDLGLNRYFPFGGFGSDSENRTVLIRKGMQRGREHVAPEPVESSFVIGDTPLDIIHGRAAGARTIAVASARYSMEDLAAHHPDLLVRDLTARGEIFDFMNQASSTPSPVS